MRCQPANPNNPPWPKIPRGLYQCGREQELYVDQIPAEPTPQQWHRAIRGLATILCGVKQGSFAEKEARDTLRAIRDEEVT